jgi:hypothetical protein
MSGGMRRVIRHAPFKYWWPIGGLLVCGLVVAGWQTGWSAGFVAVAAIVAAIYLGLPSMEAGRKEVLDGESAARSSSKHTAGTQGHKTGSANMWDTRLNPVVHDLSNAITDPEIIRDIAVKSGLAVQYVRFSNYADTYWTSVLERAQDEGMLRVDSVLDQALDRTEDTSVRDSIELYRKYRLSVRA